METRKIVRANGAGVFFGNVVEENGDVDNPIIKVLKIFYI